MQTCPTRSSRLVAPTGWVAHHSVVPTTTWVDLSACCLPILTRQPSVCPSVDSSPHSSAYKPTHRMHPTLSRFLVFPPHVSSIKCGCLGLSVERAHHGSSIKSAHLLVDYVPSHLAHRLNMIINSSASSLVVDVPRKNTSPKHLRKLGTWTSEQDKDEAIVGG